MTMWPMITGSQKLFLPCTNPTTFPSGKTVSEVRLKRKRHIHGKQARHAKKLTHRIHLYLCRPASSGRPYVFYT